MCLPTYQDLRLLYDDPNDSDASTSLTVALRTGEDPLQLLAYLRGLGHRVTNLPELLGAVRDLDGEEELAAFHCQEGVAVSVASDGRWLLFTP